MGLFVAFPHVLVLAGIEPGADLVAEVDQVDDLVLDRDGVFRHAVQDAVHGETFRAHVVVHGDLVADLVEREFRGGFRFDHGGEVLVVGAVFLLHDPRRLVVQRLQVDLLERDCRDERHLLRDLGHDGTDDRGVIEVLGGRVAVDRALHEVDAVVGELIFRGFRESLFGLLGGRLRSRRIRFRGGRGILLRAGLSGGAVRSADSGGSGAHSGRAHPLSESGGRSAHSGAHALSESSGGSSSESRGRSGSHSGGTAGHLGRPALREDLRNSEQHGAGGDHASKNPSRVLHDIFPHIIGLWICCKRWFREISSKKLRKHHTLT